MTSKETTPAESHAPIKPDYMDELKKIPMEVPTEDPTEYYFPFNFTSAERDKIIREMPMDVQNAAKMAILTRVVDEYFDPDKKTAWEIDSADPKPLAYYMAAADEKIPESEYELRWCSETWKFVHYTDGSRNFGDFEGYPGDNAHGACIFWFTGSDHMVEILYNWDSILYANEEQFEDFAVKFDKIRNNEGVDEEDADEDIV